MLLLAVRRVCCFATLPAVAMLMLMLMLSLSLYLAIFWLPWTATQGLLLQPDAPAPTKDQLNLDGVPCASVAILDHGKVTSSVISNGPEDADTIFQACSISKSITSLAVAVLVDAGTITYHTTVKPRLPSHIINCIIEPATEHLLHLSKNLCTPRQAFSLHTPHA
ncbi:uncharacterized protein MYCFIDRAFT_197828 [Pseudocercospora fijiensis CIRAD86]|uniref:Beta-lactamase-related domain-containing protein n=1 Tax=Pseudocercospora fijiensis (strain CIRAD86) TaxID=383855 RepID=M3A8L7_PSEFD|nr:uncharacterized protein MYCFIDRAFT_197828 [Pseudocercospora fijiensis CIRAD86]EME80971.1 hypothetical protein MYCFIDRAFT_197828 [Pseudocercospora fijiensis CIRAD86]